MTANRASIKNDPAHWSESRAADRRRMAWHLDGLATAAGALTEVTSVSSEPFSNDALRVAIRAPGGLCLAVVLSGRSVQPNVFVLSWYMEAGAPGELCPSALIGSVNPVHFRKATGVAQGFADLCTQVQHGVLQAGSGAAYRKAP